MNKYEIIIFDLDDTLIDNLENIRYAYKKMIDFVGEKYTEDEFIRWNEFDRQFWIDRSSGKIIIPDEYKSPKDKMIEYVRSLRYFLYFNGKITLEHAFEEIKSHSRELIHELDFINNIQKVVVIS